MSSGSDKDTFLNRVRVREDLKKALGGRPGDAAGEVVEQLLRLEHGAQRFLLHWLEVAHQCHPDLALHFARNIPRALACMGPVQLEKWVQGILDGFDNRGLGYAVEFAGAPEAFARSHAADLAAVALEDVRAFLRLYLTGLGGRELGVRMGDVVYTDTENIYLPEYLAGSGERSCNRARYKFMAAYLWAQNWYGTWRLPTLEFLRRLDDSRGIRVFASLERIRLEARLRRDLPGLWREMQELVALAPSAADVSRLWHETAGALADASATAADSCMLVERCLDLPSLPMSPCHGEMCPDRVRELLLARIDRERRQLGSILQQLSRAQESEVDTDPRARVGARKSVQWQVSLDAADPPAGSVEVDLQLNGYNVQAPAELRSLLLSMIQDHGIGPASELVAGAGAEYPVDEAGDMTAGHETDATAGYDIRHGFRYPEWDYLRQGFRDRYCLLVEREVAPVYDEFVRQTLRRYHGTLKSVRRTFEAIADSTRLHPRQRFGSEIDLDALVAAIVDVRAGQDMNDYLYTADRRNQRDIAVLFMVDMSGSTRGWVNRAEKEALVLMCEALQMLGDRYAVYGFSGRTHKRCEVYQVKHFDEPYNELVRARISGISPRTYTRMGAAIRHLGRKLRQAEAQTRLLITLSDGKPEDYGNYRGRYGIEDTRHALLEIRSTGVHPFCITIDREGGDYLPHMYGAANYSVVSDVRRLPLKISEIYRRLTAN